MQDQISNKNYIIGNLKSEEAIKKNISKEQILFKVGEVDLDTINKYKEMFLKGNKKLIEYNDVNN